METAELPNASEGSALGRMFNVLAAPSEVFQDIKERPVAPDGTAICRHHRPASGSERRAHAELQDPREILDAGTERRRFKVRVGYVRDVIAVVLVIEQIEHFDDALDGRAADERQPLLHPQIPYGSQIPLSCHAVFVKQSAQPIAAMHASCGSRCWADHVPPAAAL